MKTAKRVLAVLLAVICVIGMSACGKKSKKYEDIEFFLDNGMYDEAIYLIEQMRYSGVVDNGENGGITVPAGGKYTPSAEETELLKRLAGTYEYVSMYSSDSQPFVIREDASATAWGEEYYAVVKPNEDSSSSGQIYLYSEEKYNDYTDQTYWDSYVSYEISENGLITIEYNYRSQEQMKELMAEFYADFVGEYRNTQDNSWYDFNEITINDDYTAVIGNETYNLFVGYDYEEKPYLGIKEGVYEENPLNLDPKVLEIGLCSVLGGYFVRDDQLEYVEITADNINDYFEWSGWTVLENDLNYNAFNEIECVSARNRYMLKAEYADRLYKPNTSVALEVETCYTQYSGTKLTYNTDSGEFMLEKGEAAYAQSEPSSSVYEYLSSISYYDENNEYVFVGYYLFGSSVEIYTSRSSYSCEGSVMTDNDYYYYDYYDTTPFTVTRSMTTLALVKP